MILTIVDGVEFKQNSECASLFKVFTGMFSSILDLMSENVLPFYSNRVFRIIWLILRERVRCNFNDAPKMLLDADRHSCRTFAVPNEKLAKMYLNTWALFFVRNSNLNYINANKKVSSELYLFVMLNAGILAFHIFLSVYFTELIEIIWIKS